MNETRKVRWYEVMYVVVLVGLLAWSVFFMNPHKVAVVDMDRVFKDVGMLQKIERERQKTEFYNKGTAMLQAYNTRIKSLKDKMDDAKTQAEKDKLTAQIKASNEMFQQGIQPIQGQMQQFEAGAVATFRKRLQPFINKVAQKRGLDVVVYAGPNILYVRNKSDLTEDVVTAAKEFFAKDMPLIDPALGGAAPRR
ncbi:MAG: OmpH family outer membrane protein [bacterium]